LGDSDGANTVTRCFMPEGKPVDEIETGLRAISAHPRHRCPRR
jgi:hypothetical protein